MADVPEFTVTWSMPIEANDAIDAARQALGILRDPQSVATVFFVTLGDDTTMVDMEQVERFENWTRLDFEDLSFVPAFTAWFTSKQDLAEWWVTNQGKYV